MLCGSRVGGIKYLFKYICKGSDTFTMETVEETGRYNEIEQFKALGTRPVLKLRANSRV